MSVSFTCVICGKVSWGKYRRKYCSKACAKKAPNSYQCQKEVLKRCIACGFEFLTNKYNARYCSVECSREVNRQRAKERDTPLLRLRFEVLARDNFRCRYCGRSVQDGTTLEIDHVLCRKRGGQDISANYVTACHECNDGKGDYLLLAHNNQTLSFIAIGNRKLK